MSRYLPYGKFKWLNQKESDKFDDYNHPWIIMDNYPLAPEKTWNQ